MTASSFLQRLQSSRWARIGGFLLAVTVLATSSSYFTRGIRLASGGGSSDYALPGHLLGWTLWLALLWVCLRLRRAVLSRSELASWGRFAFEVSLCAIYAFVSVEITHVVLTRAVGPPPLPDQLSVEDFKPMMMARSALMYAFAVVSLAALSADIEKRRSDAAAKALLLQQETLKQQLTAARLASLEAQLHPHFLFNALHAIGGLILAGDRQRAHRALASLSTLLRASLKQGQAHIAIVEDELELVRQYVELEQLRFGERLQFSVEVSPEALRASLPALILLPIVENAVTHGLEPLSEGGSIELAVRRTEGRLELRVSDNGAGRAHPRGRGGASTGIGLSNTAGRLEALYGSEADMRVEDRTPRGTLVTICLPLRREVAEARQEVAT